MGAHQYAVILAGGSGTRLWPLSRKSKPKQFQALIGEKSLLQLMYQLLLQKFDKDRVYIQAGATHIADVQEQIPGIQKAQLIVEPEGRDTAPAFALAAMHVLKRDPEAALGIFYSDNFVQEHSGATFFDALTKGFEVIEDAPKRLVIIGVRPLYPHTGLGYIELDTAQGAMNDKTVAFPVRSFIEKPDLERATQLAASPNYLWNTGYKILRADFVLDLLASSDSRYAAAIPKLRRAFEMQDEAAITEGFQALPRQSFEYLVSEKSDQMLAIPADVAWSDVGDWEIIHRFLSAENGMGLATAGQVFEQDCQSTLIISYDRPVVAIGVTDLIVIETKEAVLVMKKDRSQDIKAILGKLIKHNPELV